LVSNERNRRKVFESRVEQDILIWDKGEMHWLEIFKERDYLGDLAVMNKVEVYLTETVCKDVN
jgi:hypothetical protein